MEFTRESSNGRIPGSDPGDEGSTPSTLAKYCSGCNLTLSLDSFAKKGKGYQSNCKTCRNKKNRERYQKDKSWYQERNRKRRELFSSTIRQYKEQPCADCKTEYPYYVMDFDHREEKEFNLGHIYKIKSLKHLMEEIEKCDIVCSNCHRIRTHS